MATDSCQEGAETSLLTSFPKSKEVFAWLITLWVEQQSYTHGCVWFFHIQLRELSRCFNVQHSCQTLARSLIAFGP